MRTSDLTGHRVGRPQLIGNRIRQDAERFRSIWLISAITDSKYPDYQKIKAQRPFVTILCVTDIPIPGVTVLRDLTDRLLAEKLFGASSCGMVCLL